MRAFCVTLGLVLTATVVHADEDPKQAIRDRGIVLKAGKKQYVIVVPPVPGSTSAPASTKLPNSTIYFGEPKKMHVIPGKTWGLNKVESRVLVDPWALYLAHIQRTADTYAIECSEMWDRNQTTHKIDLSPVDNATDLIDTVKLLPAEEPPEAYMLARISSTTYLYVDRRGRTGTEFRLFLGKRGAMKKIAIKDMADDADAVVLVTAKGTLTMKKGGPEVTTATWGSAKKPAAITPMKVYDNKGLIYRDLGVYTRESPAHPCYEL